MFQLLQAILFCHNRRVLHRDIKSQNILVDHSMKIVKLSDFGLSRRVPISPSPLTPTVVTLYYRSPELILMPGYYSSGVDIWSLGCVFVEMVLKQAPFRVDMEIELFYSWFTQLGVPSVEDMPDVFQKLSTIKFTQEPNSINAVKLLKEKVNANCYDLIMKMFIYNPAKRITASEALFHEVFHDFDKSVVPAIDEENVGFPDERRINKQSQVLYITPENMENISGFIDVDNNLDNANSPSTR